MSSEAEVQSLVNGVKTTKVMLGGRQLCTAIRQTVVHLTLDVLVGPQLDDVIGGGRAGNAAGRGVPGRAAGGQQGASTDVLPLMPCDD